MNQPSDELQKVFKTLSDPTRLRVLRLLESEELMVQELMDALIFCNRVLGFVNAPALMQHAIRAIQGVTVDIGDYERKRDYLHSRLTSMGYRVFKPQGAFYLFPKSPLDDDAAFVEELQAWNVLTVPGRAFGAPGFFRISYCLEDRVLQGSMEGFRQVAEKFGL